MESIEYKKMYDVECSHWWFQGRNKLIFGNLPAKGNGIKVLDIGCGTGLVAKELADRGYDVTGLDIMPEALIFCKQRGIKNIIKGDILNLPFKEGSFDIVLCLDMLYHQKVNDDEKALKEAFRIIAPGGKIIVTSCANKYLSGRHDKAVHTRHRYGLREIVEKIRKCGFSVKKASYFNTFLFPLVYVLRKCDNLINKNKPIKSEVEHVNPFINLLFKSIFFSEIELLKKVNLPFGVSLICIATKAKK